MKTAWWLNQLGCPAGTDRNDPKFVSWVVSPTNGERIEPTYIGVIIYLLSTMDILEPI